MIVTHYAYVMIIDLFLLCEVGLSRVTYVLQCLCYIVICVCYDSFILS
jgi:hypothetical protein